MKWFRREFPSVSSSTFFAIVLALAVGNILFSTFFLVPSLDRGALSRRASKLGGSGIKLYLDQKDEYMVNSTQNRFVSVMLVSHRKDNATLTLNIKLGQRHPLRLVVGEVHTGNSTNKEHEASGVTIDDQGKVHSRSYELRLNMASLSADARSVGEVVAHITGVPPPMVGTDNAEIEVEYHLTPAAGSGGATFRYGGGIRRTADGAETLYGQLSALGARYHSAAHGITFSLEAKEVPVLVTSIRCSAMALHDRGDAAPPAHVRVFIAGEDEPFDADKASVAEWRLVGSDQALALPTCPSVGVLPVEPFYVLPRQRVAVSIHSTHPLGVSIALPALEALALEASERQAAGRTLLTSLVPEWLKLAAAAPSLGVQEDQYLRLLPGYALDEQPLEAMHPLGPKAFMGLIIYTPLHDLEAAAGMVTAHLQDFIRARHHRQESG
eukprot:CAMPEP_0180400120 /NCGR_PEP_ID=MMETSP0989-20121125/37545_1 /TAXON_ID=697907 /ORGANISM="non described non described, Strain CCMP2293" /LENGTH=438 /DNA_ID=CAMNT_0022402913 /DNA_START=68 /DNA_END=1380 /DNA_ORIENTATION=-